VVTGSEALIGSVGVALEDVTDEGWARVQSEQWRVKSAVPLKRGQNLRVTGRHGLVLMVAPLEQAKEGA
jgi:membrane-bound serine protease (ClpP class)